MAKNLRAKIPASDLLVIHDKKTEATTRFVEEMGMKAGIEVASSARGVAEKSVRCPSHHVALRSFL